jgi:probable blue pigment (indigoidine) exporter
MPLRARPCGPGWCLQRCNLLRGGEHETRDEYVTSQIPPPAGHSLPMIGPALLAAVSFACADITTKLTLQAGADPLTMTLFRGFIGVPLIYAWLRVATPPKPLSARAMWLSLGIGALFAGNVFWLFKAIELVEVPIAILTYFAYPLLTGLAAAATGLEKLSWRGATAAAVAFLGLALMIGANPGGVALAGIGFGLAAASCRVIILLVTRAKLAGADPRLITWYSFLSASAIFMLLALATWNWQAPHTALGWSAMIVASIATTLAVFAVFVSTMRIGPFRTALFMNLEPLLATIGSALFLGEVITPLQGAGGAVMIAALVAFQLRR